jgi:hypothetical protein
LPPAGTNHLVQVRTEELNKQYTLMSMINDAAALLLEADDENQSERMIHGMETIGRYVEVDRVTVWQNHHKDDGKLYYKLVCQWTAEGLDDLDMNGHIGKPLNPDDVMDKLRAFLR